MKVMPAALADVPAVARIHVDAWRAAYKDMLSVQYLAALSVEQREPLWREAVETGRPELLVAKEDGAVRGWIAFGGCRGEDAPAGQAELWARYGAPDHWSRGVGRRLWRRAGERMRLHGYTGCSLWVLAGNERALRFYRSLGFAADDAPLQPLELGGRQLREVRYLCRFDGRPHAPAA
jgi:ribosomal protein S18 acetylase RimI-like enzyme